MKYFFDINLKICDNIYMYFKNFNNLYMKENTKYIITQSLRWAVFIMAWLTMTIKIVEVSAANSLQLIIANPDLTCSSWIFTYWLFFIK